MLKTRGIVIRQANYKDYDKMLTVLTGEYGLISVSARGVRSMKNKNRVACELLCYNEFVLSEPKADVYSLRECNLIESFYPLRSDVTRLALAVYMADLAGRVSVFESKELLRLLLNTLHFLQDEQKSPYVLRAIYELKLLDYSGVAPRMDGCIFCGDDKNLNGFDATGGGVVCDECSKKSYPVPIQNPAREFMNYIVSEKELKNVFVKGPDEILAKEIIKLTEKFMSLHVIDELKSLNYLKKFM